MQFSVSLEGENSIDEDYSAFKKLLNTQLNAAIRNMEAPLKDDLYRHIEKDVYATYRPKEYPRRRDNEGFGIPLNNMDANASLSLIPHGFAFSYMPDGSHSGTTADLSPKSKNYDADRPQPIKPNPVHGDDLIRRIETGKGYDWNMGNHYPGERPFWQNFVNDEMGGLLAQHFLEAMKQAGNEDIVVDWGDVVRESSDGEY